jgi:hypothetical protein
LRARVVAFGATLVRVTTDDEGENVWRGRAATLVALIAVVGLAASFAWLTRSFHNVDLRFTPQSFGSECQFLDRATERELARVAVAPLTALAVCMLVGSVAAGRHAHRTIEPGVDGRGVSRLLCANGFVGAVMAVVAYTPRWIFAVVLVIGLIAALASAVWLRSIRHTAERTRGPGWFAYWAACVLLSGVIPFAVAAATQTNESSVCMS